MQTQPLSNPVLRACADQRARQRNMGIVKKKTCELWTTISQRKAVWKTSFQTNPQELSTLCIYPKQLLNNTKNVSAKKHCLSQILPTILILQMWRNIPRTIMILTVFCFGKRAMERNASTLTQDRHDCWRCNPCGVHAPIPAWALSIFLAEGHGFVKEKVPQLAFDRTLPQLWRQQLGAQGFNILSTYLPIYLSTYLPIYLSTYLPIYLSIYLSIYLFFGTCLGDSSWYLTISLVLRTNYWKTCPVWVV